MLRFFPSRGRLLPSFAPNSAAHYHRSLHTVLSWMRCTTRVSERMLTREKGHTLREDSRRRRVRQRTRAGPSTGSTGEHPVLPVEGAARFAATADEPRESRSRRCAQAHRHGHAALAQGEHQCSLHVRRMRAVSEARARLETRVPVHVSRIHRVRVMQALESCAHRAITARTSRRTSLPRARR